jgi:AraC-like DNA-binding protein
MPHGSHTVIRHACEVGQWELTSALPPPELRRYVVEYVGWVEHMTMPLCRREPPTEIVPLIINFGAPVRIFDAAAPTRWTDFDSFITGSFDTYALVGSSGPSGGVQVNFTILGARVFLNRPLAELTNLVVSLEDAIGPAASRRLIGQLHEAPTWDARFHLLDHEIGARCAAARLPAPEIQWAWHRLVQSGGQLPIHRIVDESGWSRKHFINRFRHDLGLSPKLLARVLRFGRAVAMVKQGGARRMADLAAECGYSDQAVFARECREFAGVTPRELVKALLPDRGGFIVNDDLEARRSGLGSVA